LVTRVQYVKIYKTQRKCQDTLFKKNTILFFPQISPGTFSAVKLCKDGFTDHTIVTYVVSMERRMPNASL